MCGIPLVGRLRTGVRSVLIMSGSPRPDRELGQAIALMVRVNRPANRVEAVLDAVEIIRGRNFVSDPRDGHANIGHVDVQPAGSRQVYSHRRYLVVRQPTPQQCQQRYVIVFRHSLWVSGPNERHHPGYQIAQTHPELLNIANATESAQLNLRS
jgi:hypothetical protein